jgi:hypothetical protein
VVELKNFYNDGFGWICKNCEHQSRAETVEHKSSRLMREGEAESKKILLSNVALAKWLNEKRQTLFCPHCQTTESVNKTEFPPANLKNENS